RIPQGIGGCPSTRFRSRNGGDLEVLRILEHYAVAFPLNSATYIAVRSLESPRGELVHAPFAELRQETEPRFASVPHSADDGALPVPVRRANLHRLRVFP